MPLGDPIRRHQKQQVVPCPVEFIEEIRQWGVGTNACLQSGLAM